MTEQSLISDERDIAAQTEVDSPSAKAMPEAAGYGARLAAQRERAGLSVTDVAATLRLHPKQVRAIEQEDLDAPACTGLCAWLHSQLRACAKS